MWWFFFAQIIIYHMLITGNKKLCGVFGWNIAQEWGRKWALKRKNCRKNILFFSSLAKSAMNGCSVAVFFLIGFRFIWKKNFRKTFQRLLGRISRRVCDQLSFSMIQVSHISWNFSKSARKVSIFFAKMIDLCLLTEKNQTLNWTKYCTVAKSVGRSRPIWTSVVVRARRLRSAAGSINSGRHILESRCAEHCANDAFLTSFRATLIELNKSVAREACTERRSIAWLNCVSKHMLWWSC